MEKKKNNFFSSSLKRKPKERGSSAKRKHVRHSSSTTYALLRCFLSKPQFDNGTFTRFVSIIMERFDTKLEKKPLKISLNERSVIRFAHLKSIHVSLNLVPLSVILNFCFYIAWFSELQGGGNKDKNRGRERV